MDSLLRHWLAAHEHLVEDALHVGGAAVIRYEDLLSDPESELGHLFAFLSLPPHEGRYEVRRGLNEAYFSSFTAPRWPWRKREYAQLASTYERHVVRFGYSLLDPRNLRTPEPEITQLMPAQAWRRNAVRP
jgi:hypothetical protein